MRKGKNPQDTTLKPTHCILTVRIPAPASVPPLTLHRNTGKLNDQHITNNNNNDPATGPLTSSVQSCGRKGELEAEYVFEAVTASGTAEVLLT